MSLFTYVSLFAGLGGFELALNKLGGECVLASEIDKFASIAYSAIHGESNLRGDITKVDAADVPDHDILVGGFPCQAFSVAGKRGGFDDARGTLFFEMARLAAEKQPKLILAENVKGLVSHDKGKTLDTIVKTLNDIGYRVDFEIMNSKYFGVAQNRERIFIVGVREDLIENQPWVNVKGSTVIPKGKRRLAEYPDLKSFNFDWPKQDEVTTKLIDILEPVVDERYYLSDEKTAALVGRLEPEDTEDAPNILHNIYGGFEEKKPRVFKDESPTIRTSAGGGHLPSLLEEVEGLPIKEATKTGYAVAEEGDAVNFRFPNSNTRRGRVGKQVANTLEASGISQGVVEREGCVNNRGAIETRETSNALDANYAKGMVNHGQRTQVLESRPSPRYRIRKLTPLECFRLQGFSDEVHQTVVDAGISDSQRYKQAGNAVTVNVIESLGLRLLPLLNRQQA
ncbi:DNA (cytosine-5-)-methyltransferase [Bacillus sp. 7894-2]|uniref:DNA (cytosine-5-)-methyltransferase n=1 Tax=Bacillus sp. 7894-2 TaxID=2021695 RepID=UPI000BA56DB6|nr:DNA (cytosine-5-)-methyltransferase [Bacillus sp. 7894-2]PAE24048.1 hypothetical protein CHI10_14690 [Bacillus sp. 7894-2]